MKYKFILTQIANVPSVMQWGWLIDNEKQLLEWIEIKTNRATKEYMDMKTKFRGSHYDSHVKIAMDLFFYAYDANTKNPKRKNIIDDSNCLTDLFISPLLRVYEKFGELFVWNNLFSFASTTGYNYLKTISKDIRIFPEMNYTKNDIRIIQWKGGSHWYAKLGNIDIEEDGEQKWSTYNEANKIANKYLKEANKEK